MRPPAFFALPKSRVRASAVLAAAVLASAVLAAACENPSSPPAPAAGRYNPDLSLWKTASWTPFGPSERVRAFAAASVDGRGVYVAAAWKKIAYSYNGDVWECAETAFGARDIFGESGINFNGAAGGGGYFVAAGEDGRAAYSEDGVTWMDYDIYKIPGFSSGTIYGVAYGGGYFVAVGEGGAIAACPASAVSMKNAAGWKARPDNGNRFASVTINSVVYSDSTKKFYIAANGGNMGWAAAADFGASSGALDWHHYGYSSGTKLSGANVQKIAFGRRGASYALGVTYNDGRGIALIDESAFCVSDGWDADLETFGFMGHPVYAGICFGAPEAGGDGYWLAAGEAAYIGWWPSAAPSDTSSRWWTALSFKEFHSWGIHCVAAMNGLFFVGGDGGKIAYSGGLRP